MQIGELGWTHTKLPAPRFGGSSPGLWQSLHRTRAGVLCRLGASICRPAFVAAHWRPRGWDSHVWAVYKGCGRLGDALNAHLTLPPATISVRRP